MKKLKLLIFIFFTNIIIYLVIINIPKSYEVEYKINDYSIIEKYNKDNRNYSFYINNDNSYYYSFIASYKTKRRLINKIDVNTNKCLKISFKCFNSQTVCINDDEYVFPFYYEAINDTINYKFDNINVYSLDNSNYYIWNYNHIDYINNNNIKELKLFDHDVYNLKLVTNYKEYLIIPDHSDEYIFDSIYLINTNNGKLKKVKLDRKIYFDSYVLGTYKKYIYLYDIHEEKEYRIDPIEGIVDKNEYEYLYNNKWINTTKNRLNKKEILFNDNDNNNYYYYFIKNKKLYYNMNEKEYLITDMEVNNLIMQDSSKAYFISKDSLYMVNHNKIIKVLSYSEWNFNNSNIFIFNNK